ncbi:MAG: heme-binding protein, partial [Acidobacteria bacterium]|nr:heme-binding protein [Acidobacteriota bacterium]
MKRLLFALFPLLLLSGELMATEQPRYEVLRRDGNLELRRYEPYIVAEIEVRASFEEAGSAAFRPLANYIFGENRRSEKMEMTVPVTQAPKGETIGMTAPVIQSGGGEGTWVVSFVMPSRYTLASLPEPADERIRFRV